MTIEIRKIEAYKSTCPRCSWSTTNEQFSETKATMEYHMEYACPHSGYHWSK